MKERGKGKTRFLCYRQEELFSLWWDGKNDCEIAEIIGCSQQSIWEWRKRNGLPCNSEKTSWTLRGKQEELLKLWWDGKNDCEIAAIVGCTPSSICNWRRRNDLPRNCERGRNWRMG